MVPPEMDRAPGLRAAVYTKAMWEKAQRNEKIDEARLRPFDLKFKSCPPADCTAEVEASDGLIASMSAGAGLMILAINKLGEVIGYPVPLNGFGAALAGPPVDREDYNRMRQPYSAMPIRNEQLYKEYIAKQKASGKWPDVVPAPAKP
jgi:Invasion associated locus B (IalB) protein